MADRLRIASFNLESLDLEPGRSPPFEERVAVLRPQLLRLSADILCLQEINAQAPAEERPRRLLALDRLLAGTPYADFARVVSTGPGGQGPADVHNLVTLSRPPIRDVRQYRNDLVPPPTYRAVTAAPPMAESRPIAWDRPLLHSVHEAAPGIMIHVVNLHLRAPLAAFIPGQKLRPFMWKTAAGWAEGFFIAAVQRTGQALEARLVVDRLFDVEPDALIAVCGDFNAELRETPLRALRADVADTGNPALGWRRLIPLEARVPASRRFSVLHGGRRVLLDHLLVSLGLHQACRGAEIHNQELQDELLAYESGQPRPESFHAPVVAEFDLSLLPG